MRLLKKFINYIFKSKTKKDLEKVQNELQKTQQYIDYLSNIVDEDREIIKTISIYQAIGWPIPKMYNEESNFQINRFKLLIEARQKGFFDEDTYFIPVQYNTESQYFFSHSYSTIARNYRYDDIEDELWIPVIGEKGNFSSGCICIYEKGNWAPIFKKE